MKQNKGEWGRPESQKSEPKQRARPRKTMKHSEKGAATVPLQGRKSGVQREYVRGRQANQGNPQPQPPLSHLGGKRNPDPNGGEGGPGGFFGPILGVYKGEAKKQEGEQPLSSEGPHKQDKRKKTKTVKECKKNHKANRLFQ